MFQCQEHNQLVMEALPAKMVTTAAKVYHKIHKMQETPSIWEETTEQLSTYICNLCRDRYWFIHVNNLQPSLTTWTFLHISTCISACISAYIYIYANNIYHKPSETQFLEFSASTGDPTFDVPVPTRAHADQATDRETHRTRAPRSRSVGMTFMCWNDLNIFEMDIYMIYDIWWYDDMILWILRGTLFLDKVRIWSYTHRHLVYTYIYTYIVSY
jgi:hypothetical protein